VYQSLQSAQPVQWQDVSGAQAALTAAEQTRFLARFHVRLPGGELRSGAAAFVALWLVLPGWRWLGLLASLPGATPVLELLYTGFLRIRPGLQHLARAMDVAHLPSDMVADLRTDHAGETGAVAVYKGMLWSSRDPMLLEFARRHLATEQQHLEAMNALLPPLRRSCLLPLWRVAGFLTGAIPALWGRTAVFSSVAAIEAFVHAHYSAQIDRLAGRTEHRTLQSLLADCSADEVEHLEEAKGHISTQTPWLLQLWCSAIHRGSIAGVWLTRRM
jgi:demethoxyubiquinone hydroxylase (CLK1/Coq7/Cat5 family)